MDANRVEHLKLVVAAAGGQWGGLQEGLGFGGPDLVLFNSKRTKSTLALPDDEFFTVAAVQERIRLSDETFMENK